MSKVKAAIKTPKLFLKVESLPKLEKQENANEYKLTTDKFWGTYFFRQTIKNSRAPTSFCHILIGSHDQAANYSMIGSTFHNSFAAIQGFTFLLPKAPWYSMIDHDTFAISHFPQP